MGKSSEQPAHQGHGSEMTALGHEPFLWGFPSGFHPWGERLSPTVVALGNEGAINDEAGATAEGEMVVAKGTAWLPHWPAGHRCAGMSDTRREGGCLATSLRADASLRPTHGRRGWRRTLQFEPWLWAPGG